MYDLDGHIGQASSDGAPISDPIAYHRLAGALQYLTVTKPDIVYDVQ